MENRLIKNVFSLIAIMIWSNHCLGQNKGLFENDEILEISLKGDFNSLFKNISG